MAEFYLTNKAVQDLKNIWNYTFSKWSEEQADRYYRLLLNSCQDVADNPTLGKNYDGIEFNLLGLKTSRHIIFYRKRENDNIEIIRILHGRMDLRYKITE